MANAMPQHMTAIQRFATFAGREIARMTSFGGGERDATTGHGPTEMCNAGQHVLEPILLDAVRDLGGDVALRT